MASMRFLDLTLPTAAENLALDEALLDEAEAADGPPPETLRLWEPAAPMVVVGRSSKIEAEVRLDACRELGFPVLRRSSGGAAVVAGPGCLMYAVVLSYERRPALRKLKEAHRWTLGAIAGALGAIVPGVAYRGTSDLALNNKKFSGNSVRCRRRAMLYHGTLLYDFPLELIERCLAMPPRMPDYRAGRAHRSFLTNLSLQPETLKAALREAFDAREPLSNWPASRVRRLVEEKYGRAD